MINCVKNHALMNHVLMMSLLYVISITEFRNGLSVIKRFVTCRSDNDHLNALNDFQEILLTTVRQISITDCYN